MEKALERAITFLEEVRTVPVLLSMLVLCLRSRNQGDALPSTRLELYTTAMANALRADGEHEGGFHALRAVAVANMRATRREFTSRHVRAALGEQVHAWTGLKNALGELPLIKVLEEEAPGVEGAYQFRHLSFAEALYATWIKENAATFDEAKDMDSMAAFLKEPFYANTCRIGGGECDQSVRVPVTRYTFAI